MSMWKIGAGAVVCALLMLTVKKERSEYALLIEIAGAAALLYLVSSYALSLADLLGELSALGDTGSGYVRLLIKALGICITAAISADICRDNGATALAGAVETAGKLIILALCAPMLTTAVRVALSFM